MKQIDDTLMWASSVEEMYNRTAEYLSLVSKNGVVLNPLKFKFCKKEVDFSGFTVGNGTIRPMEKHLEAIASFPRPTSTTNMKSYMALCNQVAYAFPIKEILQPFRDLLCAGRKFYWDDTLQTLFENSRKVISDCAAVDISSFDMEIVTSLETDWCKEGMGYWLQ